MFNRIIALSLQHRWPVLLAALMMTIVGVYQLATMPVDVFPDLNRPTVTVMTEAPGLAPEEVETLVTRPIEFLLNGAAGVERVRSASAVGLSIVWVEFAWGTDIDRDRQVVNERVQIARSTLPNDVVPILAPVSSIMGEIMLIALRPTAPPADEAAQLRSALELRTLAEFTIRNRLLAVSGVSQVTVMGGVLKQYQVITSPERLAAQSITLQQLTDAAASANALTGGGIIQRGVRESIIRINGQGISLAEIGETPTVWRGNRAIKIKDVADVKMDGPVRRGDGGVLIKTNESPPKIVGGPAVILVVQKQPGANTLELDPQIDRVIDQLRGELPAGITIEAQIFRQADFIRTAVDNVVEAIRDGAIWVVVILFIFLANFRTSFITLTAIPLSVLTTLLIFRWFGVSINTMTLGGLAVAVGELVDDAIVDVENIYRRLKENRTSQNPLPAATIVYRASSEVRNSIVYATLIVCLAVAPLFAMVGLEGRMFAPLGLAYLLSLMMSLVVSLTVTPALASVLLPRARFIERGGDPWLLRNLKWLVAKWVRWSLRHPWPIVAVVAILGVGSKFLISAMGTEFLPPFNEGTLTVNVELMPGTSLQESTRVAERVQLLLMAVPEVVSVTRRTGRAELDEHAEGVNASEMDVRLSAHETPKPGFGNAVLRAIPGFHQYGVVTSGRPHDVVFADIRSAVNILPNVAVNVGQPISHRLDHVMSGVRAQIAIKVFGHDLRELRSAAEDVRNRIAGIKGVADLQVEPQVEVSQIRLQVNRTEAARFGLAPGDIAKLLETAYKGRAVATLLEEDRYFPLVVWFDERARSDPSAIGQTILDTPSGRKVALSQVADILDTTGPNTINREGLQRRIVVACNVEHRDLGSVVADISAAIRPVEEKLQAMRGGYRIEIGGQFQAQQQATRQLTVLAALAVTGIFLLLWKCMDSWRAALMVLLVNIPLAAVGSVIALMLINRPEWSELSAVPFWQWPFVWASETTLSIAHWVGFITLLGIVSRNGIMMISHYIHLMKHEGESFSEEMIVRGTLERLAPVLMTALTAIMGLIPLALGAGQTGKEILHPLAIVVIGGLLDATIMDQIVTPAVFWKFGKKVYQPELDHDGGDILSNGVFASGAKTAVADSRR